MIQVVEIIGAIILVLLTVVLIHEGGHFIVGKLCGIRVDEFSVGFGPRLAKKTIGETTYSLRAIPAGGYVKMAGMLGLEGEADAGERNFYRATIPKRLATLLAGIVFNLVFAGLLFTVIDVLPVGSTVQAGAAAQSAGLRSGDVIVSVDGRAIRHDSSEDVSADLHAATAAANGRPMTVVYTGGGATHSLTIAPSLIVVNGVTLPAVSPSAGATPKSTPPVSAVTGLTVGGEFVVTTVNGHPVGSGDPAQVLRDATASGFLIAADGSRGSTLSAVAMSNVVDGPGEAGKVEAAWRLGVKPSYDGEPITQALGDGFGQIPTFITSTYSSIANIISDPNSGGLNGPQGLSGPVGIVRETATATQAGGRSLASWIAFISMNLGLLNVLPIPFLDGGKAVLILIEAVRRKRLDPRREALIYAVGLAVVVIFAIYVTIGDVSRPG